MACLWHRIICGIFGCGHWPASPRRPSTPPPPPMAPHAHTNHTCRQICGIDCSLNFRSRVISLSICGCRLLDTDVVLSAAVCRCVCASLLPSVRVATLTPINGTTPKSLHPLKLSPKVCGASPAEGHIHNASALLALKVKKPRGCGRLPVNQEVYWSIGWGGTPMPGKARAHAWSANTTAGSGSGSSRQTRAPTGERCTVSSSSLPARPGVYRGIQWWGERGGELI